MLVCFCYGGLGFGTSFNIKHLVITEKERNGNMNSQKIFQIALLSLFTFSCPLSATKRSIDDESSNKNFVETRLISLPKSSLTLQSNLFDWDRMEELMMT